LNSNSNARFGGKADIPYIRHQKGTKHIRGMLICSDSDSMCMSVGCRRSKLRVEARGALIMSLGESL
jgi:hypothetical protein